MDTDSSGEQFGQRRPPLSVTIRQILDRYPDGQIFKEMIQNADDAGASVIQFYLDCRKHGSRGLVKKELESYQGPALISANDAMFSDKDWEGIQSLQQSIKADDPFKVGRFGIGFNSVYHLTDFPTIISGNRIAFLEPQEKVWRGESGRSFTLDKLPDTSDHLTPLHDIAGFNAGSSTCYPKTLFRFPLRNAVSDLSENIYSLEKVNELINALRSEAKLLLLFLRSIHTIEVYNINEQGEQTLSFQMKVADAFVEDLKRKRAAFLEQLTSLHSSKKYDFSSVIKFTSKFDISVHDTRTQISSTSHWLVANKVDPRNKTVREASVKQKVFPWVGTAVELDSPGNGRIFCFLPMPIETASNLPVHVNGTFGLNDDRRNLKWPGVERKNDASANWNELLIKQVIPSCYSDLLLQAKLDLGSMNFYKAWPSIMPLSSKWDSLLTPIFNVLLQNPVIWSESVQSWVTPNQAVYIPKIERCDQVVERALINCGVKIAEVPSHVDSAFKHINMQVKEVTPQLVREELRKNHTSYASIDLISKHVLLKYCLKDGCYSKLSDLHLLPLANGTFDTFKANNSYYGLKHPTVYICTQNCPKSLLPNLEHKLVDIQKDSDLRSILIQVAKTSYTQLKELAVPDIPGLLKECIPMEFQNARSIAVPNNFNFPSDWFPMFWRWVENKQLKLFANNFILPIRTQGEQHSASHFNVVKLSTKPTLYIQDSSCSDTMLSVLSKFDILCCVQNQFSYVTHREMKKLTNSYDANGVLDAIYQTPKYDISITDQEAKCLRVLLGTSADSIRNECHNVLKQVKIFTVKHNKQLYSNNDVCNQSLLKTSLAVNSGEFDITLLPSSIILFSDDNYHQNQLLKVLKVDILDMKSFLILYIFPRIINDTISGTNIDTIMQEVLKIFNSLKIKNKVITNLCFIKTSAGTRKTPVQLFDPNNEDMCNIFDGESVFPNSPYDQPESLKILRLCGLRTSITAQEVLDTIYSFSFSSNSSPQLVDERTFSRAKAVLSYLGRNTFYNQHRYTQCTLPGNLHRGNLCFPDALNLLSSNRCWLPILAVKPSCYPQQLPWKGDECTLHLCTLNSTLSISCISKASHPELYGSQIYFTEPIIESGVLSSEESPRHLVEHLEVVISHINSFTSSEMMEIIHQIYGCLQRTPESDLGSLKLVKKWVYIRSHHTFVDPRAVALEQNPSFRHNLEPYLHKLPDSLSNYSNLFKAFGVNSEFSKEQIISVFAAVREDIGNNSMSITADDSWNVVIAILNWLTENGTNFYSGSLEGIYVPIKSDSEWPDLQPANEVTYTDNEFLKNFTISSESEKPLVFIHKCVNIKIAEFLQLTPLSKELDIAGDTFEDTGQSEPLTTRLKNILRDYKDGITIVKELIQNADDALATEVNICYDARTHSKETGQLFYPGMAESHGPALVIHNNQVFSDEDFENITKLAGATKQNKHLKIGKFGIGFCSVYHITDIPSFISQDKLYIFDPTLNYLGNDGKRLKFNSRIILNSKQLEPYLNLFGFTGRENYKNTMFRLPFRTGASELSGKIYSEATVLELLDEIYSCSESLILFLQHVKTITFQRINNGDTLPTTLFSVKKEGFTLPHSLSLPNTTPLSVDSKKGEESKNSKWLVSSHSTVYSEKDAVSNVACKLNSESNSDRFSPCGSLSGEIFCYLPLSQYTGLPVHVSSNFAVINNRRGIWTGEECASAKDGAEVQWNNFLMERLIPSAYLSLLNSLKCMQKKDILDNYSFYSLWPLTSELKQHNPWSKFVSMLYKDIETSSLFFSESRGDWRSMKDCNFLEPNILSKPTPDCVLEVLYHCEYPVVDLPINYRTHIFIGESLINEMGFIALFFKHLETFDDLTDSRNAVIRLMLELYISECEVSKILKDKLTSNACIPCSPDGIKIKKVSDLIHPEAPFVKLYDSNEAMFPLEELVKRNLSDLALKKLGIIFEKLPWNYIIDRAHTVRELVHSNPSICYKRVKFIMEAITSHTDGKPPATSHIDTIEFLPVMKKPADFPLNWPGDGITLSCGRNMMRTGQRPKMPTVRIAGSQAVFLSEVKPQDKGCSHISDRAEDILGMSLTPSFSSVLAHFKLIIINAGNILESWISIACEQIYEYFDKNFTGSTECFEGLPYIWTENKFVYANQVSKEWSLNGPYLYQVSRFLRSKESLCSNLGVKERFSTEDIQPSLINMQRDYKNRSLDKKCQDIFTRLIPLLHDGDYKDGKFLLPDENYILHAAECLAYNDAHWAPRDDKYTYVHDIIPRVLATKIGVKPVSSKFLDKYSSVHDFKGRAFGQKEDLTRRIQNIIRDYPLDVTLLKELLQNADDAKATKMHIILDKRFHGTDSVLSNEWQDLQGPALLVWNDSVFSEKDLEGIQELGMGSKRSEAETIGQYGIGFNVVYHITDCPSFVTNGETLCVLDPHYRYVPGSDVLQPGRRFDKINQGFWKDFPDVRSAYLRDNVDNLPPELLKGSLFRFPIRHNRRTISHSEISEDPESVIDVDCFGDELKSWMKKMKEAMLFLNNISEVKFCVIEEKNSKMQTVFHFKSKIEESATPDRTSLQTALSTFKRDQECRSCAIMYPLTLTEVGESEDMVEKWLIQQGVGDIYKGDQHWQFMSIVKPRHGIAAPLSITTKREEFKGQVFCFLPLPVQSGLPVHVNGHFILNSTRRELWRSTDIHNSDDRDKWNNNLVEALSSSYSDFLYHARTKYVAGEYKNIGTALSSIEHYYSLFPSSIRHKDTMWNNLALGMYRVAIEHNLPVLCVLKSSSDGKSFITEWHPPKGITPATQVYYWEPFHYNSSSHKDIVPILENIGMKITPAKCQTMECFTAILKEAKSGVNLSSVTRHSIFEYYTKYSSFSASVMRETAIEDTAFQNVKSFVLFTKYILGEKINTSSSWHTQRTPVSSKYNIYPSSPFSHYLLLTADKTLRQFEENNKVLKSFHSELFSNSLHSFLHPELLDANYTSSYFIQPNDTDSTRVDNLILEMIGNNFPRTLKSVSSVTNATATISEDQLKSLWKCFAEDKVMTKHLPTILNHWAFLLTQDNRLFSFSSTSTVPVHHVHMHSFIPSEIVAVMKKISMPFLNTNIVIAETGCPKLIDSKRILSNFYAINQDSPLLQKLSRKDLDVMIEYFHLHLRDKSVYDSTVIVHLQSLPLFESIDGNYTSIWRKNAYIWPTDACSIAYKKWLEGHNAVFIKGSGKWLKMGSARELSVSEIFTEILYTQFIFPHFNQMNSRERYQHLEHIRDYLFNSYKANSKILCRNNVYKKKNRANEFICALKNLQCIGNDGSTLRPVSDYCDQTVAIFGAFSQHFMFLPDEYSKEYTWLTFFRKIGLKQSVFQEDFILFCQETASGKVNAECSNILLHHLAVIETSWHQYHQFLVRISNIAFLQQEHLPKLTWLVDGAYPVNQMVPLKGSAPLHRAPLIWTVMPVVQLPLQFHSETSTTKMLGITVNPSVAEVVENVTNICRKSHYAQISLFDNYPRHLVCDTEHHTLLHIMSEIFSHLNLSRMLPQNDLMKLQALPCIPVHHAILSNVSTSQGNGDCPDRRMVLVKPSCVIQIYSHDQWSYHDVIEFHPYLHLLPDFKHNYSIGKLLGTIGVKSNLELSHIQIALESAFRASEGQELGMNTEKCVKSAIKKLYNFLQEVRMVEGTSLSPMYLPDSDNKLKPSKSLLYGDTISYWSGDLELDLSNVPYSYFNILPADYHHGAMDICRVLPESVRPIALSSICKQVVFEESRESEESKLALQLTESIEIAEIPDGVAALVNKLVGKQDREDELKEIVKRYLEKIEVVTVKDLESKVVLKESEQCIGHLKIKFCYVPGETKSLLYLDSSLSLPPDDENVYIEVADHLCSLLCEGIKGNLQEHEKKQFLDMIIMCLKCKNGNAVIDKLRSRFGVHLDGIRMRRFAAKLGEEIPDCWHHRLDQDIDNVFNPMEYVGYEDKNDHIIVVQIAYPENPKEGELELEKRYRIYAKEDDKEGLSVSILNLFKFLVGEKKSKLKPTPAQNEDLAVIPFDGQDEITSYRAEDTVETKKKICSQLREIWKLSPDLRRRAVKRLYLKWHPDKHPNPKEAEIYFKYLMKQLEHLEKGEPLDDPEAGESQPGCSKFNRWYPNSNYEFKRWNRTAGSHSTYSEDERDFFSGGSGGSKGTGGSDGSEHGGGSGGMPSSSQSSSHFFPFDKEEDNKKPEEGERWVQQAEAEFKVLSLVHSQGDQCSGYFYSCFMAQQVAEKALKGGVYALCGMDGRSLNDHNLTRHARALEAVNTRSIIGLVSHAIPLEDYYLKTRYPNHWTGYTDTPADHYTSDDADDAKEHAKAILSIVRAVMPEL